MKPIIGGIAYKELTPEEIARFTREAEEMRAEAIRNMFGAAFRALAQALVHAGHGFRALVANPGSHPAAKPH